MNLKVLKPKIEADVVRGYRLLQEVGNGGTGQVFRALRLSNGDVVAIKILYFSLVNDLEMVRRFKQEAELTIQFCSRNIVAVHEYGVIHDGRPYLVMDYLEGFTLGSLMSYSGAMVPLQALPIFIQLAAGLAHIHEKGVIHRDIKPNNIMLTSGRGQEKIVKLVDFGIAKIYDENNPRRHEITSVGETIGSPLYMSPEQCLGRPISTQSDIYSMGVVMYEALTGRVPFMAREAVTIMSQHAYQDPAPLGLAEATASSGIEHIVLKALAKKPEDRYAYVSDLKSELQFCLYRLRMDQRSARVISQASA